MMSNVIVVAAGGALGAVLRYLISATYSTRFEALFVTIAINSLGCLAIGMLSAVFAQHSSRPELSLFLIVGFLGAFTTYSAFGLQSFVMLSDFPVKSIVAVTLQILLGLSLVWLGRVLGSVVFS